VRFWRLTTKEFFMVNLLRYRTAPQPFDGMKLK